jgi:mono/diheme cytochrome c family protein
MRLRFIATFFALACALALAACSHGDQSSQSASAVASATPPVVGDVRLGKQLYATNCVACHGATGTEGGVGPSLANERVRKNDAQAIAWIKDPQPPMPKLYPGSLSDADVINLAAYVESL